MAGKGLGDILASQHSSDDRELISKMREVHDREWELCARDFWYCAENYFQTEDEERQSIRPFPSDWPFLHEIYDAAENHKRVIVLKPRRMFVSWTGMARKFHHAFFAGSPIPDYPPIYYGGIMSIGETEALYLVERVTKLHTRMPAWMKARNPIQKDNELLKVWSNGGKLQAFPLKRQGPQTFGFSDVFFDEMAWQDAVRGTWKGLIPTLGSHGGLLAVSTPNGKFNLFHDVWSNKGGMYDGFKRIAPDWWACPEHTEEWFKMVTQGLTKNEIAQMFLKSFSSPTGDAVWPEYDDRTHMVDQTEVYKNRPMFIGWDLGYHFPACVFMQRNHLDQWVGHRELQGYNMDFEDFVNEALVMANTFYERGRIPEIHCIPHDAHMARRSGRSGAINDRQVIKDKFKTHFGDPQFRVAPHEVGTRRNEGPRLKEVRALWKLRADGNPGFIFNKLMELFREGCLGGYSYGDSRSGITSEQPVESEFTHIQDAVQNVVCCFNRLFLAPARKHQSQERQRIGHGTGL